MYIHDLHNLFIMHQATLSDEQKLLFVYNAVLHFSDLREWYPQKNLKTTHKHRKLQIHRKSSSEIRWESMMQTKMLLISHELSSIFT